MVVQFPARATRPATADRRVQLIDLHYQLRQAGIESMPPDLQAALRAIGCFNERQALMIALEMLLARPAAGQGPTTL